MGGQQPGLECRLLFSVDSVRGTGVRWRALAIMPERCDGRTRWVHRKASEDRSMPRTIPPPRSRADSSVG